MNVINYNFKKHFELLNHEKNFINQDKSFFKANKAGYFELM